MKNGNKSEAKQANVFKFRQQFKADQTLVFLDDNISETWKRNCKNTVKIS